MLLLKTILLSVGLLTFAALPVDAASEVDNTIQGDQIYEIDMPGKDARVVEFTPKSDPSKVCVAFIMVNFETSSLQCFDKPTQKEPPQTH